MSVWAKVWAYEQHPKQVQKTEDGTVVIVEGSRSPASKAVLVALAEFPTVGERACWPGQKTLADMTDLDERSVRRALWMLEEQGLIRREERRRPNGARTTDQITLLGPPERFGPHQHPPDSLAGGPRTDVPPQNRKKEPEVTPSLRSGVRQAAKEEEGQGKVIPLSKYHMDRIYDALKARGIKLPNSEYSVKLGRVKHMLDTMDPTVDELDRLPAAYVEQYGFKGDATDAVSALNRVRSTAIREEARQQRREEVASQNGGRPPWEQAHPFGAEREARQEAAAKDKAAFMERMREKFAQEDQQRGDT